MKITLFDPYAKKFTQDMIDWWEQQGHEVQYSNYYNPKLVHDADVLFFFTCDNNIASATNPGQALLADDANYQPWDLHDHDLTGKKVIVMPIDIEVWGGHQHAAFWDVVDEVICIAPHIQQELNIEGLPKLTSKTNFHVIPFSVNLDRWTLKERQPGFEIAVVSERWASKGTDLILQVLLKLKQIDERYKTTWLGQWGGQGQWEPAYLNDFVAHHGLNIEFINILNDGRTVDEFLDDKNYLLHGSKKEAFSAATAEAMAKGIKPVVHRFYGADDLWPDMTWDSIDQAVEMITNQEYDSAKYRQYLIDHEYTTSQMMERIDKVIKGEVR